VTVKRALPEMASNLRDMFPSFVPGNAGRIAGDVHPIK
jgi:hypothetical protein